MQKFAEDIYETNTGKINSKKNTKLYMSRKNSSKNTKMNDKQMKKEDNKFQGGLLDILYNTALNKINEPNELSGATSPANFNIKRSMDDDYKDDIQKKRLKLNKNSYISNKLTSPAHSGYYNNDYDQEIIKAQEKYKNSYITKVTREKNNQKIILHHTQLNPIEIDNKKIQQKVNKNTLINSKIFDIDFQNEKENSSPKWKSEEEIRPKIETENNELKQEIIKEEDANYEKKFDEKYQNLRDKFKDIKKTFKPSILA